MLAPRIVINPQERRSLERAFDRSIKVGDYMIDQAQEHAMRIAQEAQQRSSAVSSRISSSFVLEQDDVADNFISVRVASQFVGYPTSPIDDIGDASEASSRGWATFTHRFDLGYDGTNPAAGYTPAYRFLTRPFERLAEQWADRVFRRAIRAWAGRR